MNLLKKRFASSLLLIILALPILQGCFALVAAGVAGGVLVAVDRRSVGVQTDDESIEWKALNGVTSAQFEKAHLNFTSFNRRVLITGEVPNEEARAEISRVVLNIPNVQAVYNEVKIAPASSIGARSNDSFITTKVKSRSIDFNGKFNPSQLKVITEAEIVYLMGIMSREEAESAIQLTRTTSGVKKVINLIEILAVEKVRELDMLRAKEQQNKESAPANSR